MFAQAPFAGRQGHGGHWQVPQGTRPVMLLLYNREHPHQQRMLELTFGVRRVVAAHPGLVP